MFDFPSTLEALRFLEEMENVDIKRPFREFAIERKFFNEFVLLFTRRQRSKILLFA